MHFRDMEVPRADGRTNPASACNLFKKLPPRRDAQTLCAAQIFVDSLLNRSRSGDRRAEPGELHASHSRCPIAPAESHASLPVLRTPDGNHRHRTRAVSEWRRIERSRGYHSYLCAVRRDADPHAAAVLPRRRRDSAPNLTLRPLAEERRAVATLTSTPAVSGSQSRPGRVTSVGPVSPAGPSAVDLKVGAATPP
jgi:hypothetical protein